LSLDSFLLDEHACIEHSFTDHRRLYDYPEPGAPSNCISLSATVRPFALLATFLVGVCVLQSLELVSPATTNTELSIYFKKIQNLGELSS